MRIDSLAEKILPLIVIFAILTILLLVYWLFFSSDQQLVGGPQVVQVIDYTCQGGINSQIMIRNAGTGTLNLGSCTDMASVTGETKECGDLTITRTDDGRMNGRLSATILPPGAKATFYDICTSRGLKKTCTYIFTTSSSYPATNAAIIMCSG